MPTSDLTNVSPIMIEVWRTRPSTILDLGAGMGKYGMLCRELLDIGQGRLTSKDWVINIIGVEGFAGYHNPVHDYYYNSVQREDFTDAHYKNFDLVLLVDSLEHIPKDAGHKLLDRLLEHNKRVIVSCPTGAGYGEQGAWFGNEMERHRAHWTPDDFELRGGRILHRGICVVASIKGQTQGRENLWIR